MLIKELTDVEKLAIVQEIEDGHIGINAVVRKFGFNKTTLKGEFYSFAN
ncbi:MAG: hypothetical protein KZY74_20055 [Paenibacillaceae bacterium]|nr:hypothetical protein [Paenibacillaceae bacterium]